MVQKMNGNVTCENCWWYGATSKRCQTPVPMWVLERFNGSVQMARQKLPGTDASNCPTWRKRWVEEI